KKLLEINGEEKVYFALARCLITKGARLSDPDAFFQASKILSSSDHFKTKEAKAHALLLQAEAINSHQEIGENVPTLFQHAAEAFGDTFKQLKGKDPSRAVLALKSQIQAYQKCNTLDSLHTAYDLLKENIKQDPQEAQELCYLLAMVACRLAEEEP